MKTRPIKSVIEIGEGQNIAKNISYLVNTSDIIATTTNAFTKTTVLTKFYEPAFSYFYAI